MSWPSTAAAPKPLAALLTMAGSELARCRGGPANLYRDPVAGLAAITAAWLQLCADAGLQPGLAAGTTMVSAGLAGVSGETQRQAFASTFAPFAARRLSSDGYTAFLGVFGTAPGAMLSIGTGVVAYRRAAAATCRVSAAAGAFRWPIAAAVPGSVSGSPASIWIGWMAAASSPTAACGRLRGHLGRTARRSWIG